MIKLTLPFPPYTNNLYFSKMVKNRVIRIPTSQATNFKKQVAKICRFECVQPFVGEVAVSINVYRPRRVGDLDGTFKALFDGLKGWAFEDDKQIVEIHAVRYEDKVNPRVEIEITALGLC